MFRRCFSARFFARASQCALWQFFHCALPLEILPATFCEEFRCAFFHRCFFRGFYRVEFFALAFSMQFSLGIFQYALWQGLFPCTLHRWLCFCALIRLGNFHALFCSVFSVRFLPGDFPALLRRAFAFRFFA